MNQTWKTALWIASLVNAVFLSAAGNPLHADGTAETVSASSPAEQLRRGGTVRIEGYSLTGNTVINSADLEPLILPYLGEILRFEDISELRDRLTDVYIERGYISSGVVIDLSALNTKTLSISVVEGQLEDVEIVSDGRLRDRYIKNRISPLSNEVVNILDLEERLQILRQNRRIKDLDSKLLPGGESGKAVLSVDVRELTPYRSSLEISNHESPSIGSVRALLSSSHDNVSGWGDSLSGDIRFSEGLNAWNAQYSIPVNRRDATLVVGAQQSSSEIVDDVFSILEISSTSSRYLIGAELPLHQSRSSRFAVSLNFVKKRSESFLLDEPTSFSDGMQEGVVDLSVVETGLSWSQRSRQRALAVSATISTGLDVAGATVSRNGDPDGQFNKLFGQFQWTQRISLAQSQIIARVDFQSTDSELVGLEKFSIGGQDTVRGYRESAFSGDLGGLASLTWNIPVRTSMSELSQLQVSPFLNTGVVQDVDVAKSRTQLSSAGLGFQFGIGKHVRGDIHWATRFNEAEGSGDLQDSGVHARVLLTY